MLDTEKIFYINEQVNKELDSFDEYIDMLQKNCGDFFIFKDLDWENIKCRIKENAINEYMDPNTGRIRKSMIDELYNYYSNKSNYITNPFIYVDTDDNNNNKE